MKYYSLPKIVVVAVVFLTLFGSVCAVAQKADSDSQVQVKPNEIQENTSQTSSSLNMNMIVGGSCLGVSALSLVCVIILLLQQKSSKKEAETQKADQSSASQDILTKLEELKGAIPKKNDFPTVEGFSTNVQAKLEELLKKHFPKTSNEDLAKSMVKDLNESLVSELNEIKKFVQPLEDTRRSLENMLSKSKDALYAVDDAKENLKKAKEDFEKEKTALLIEKQQLQSKIEAAKAEQELNTRTIVQKEMEATVNNLNADIKSLQAEKLSDKQKVSELEAKAAQADAEGYKRGLDEGMARLGELSTQNGTLTQQLKESKTLFQAEMETAKAQVTASVAKEWEAQVAGLQTRISEKETNIQKLENKLEMAEAELQQNRQKTAEQEKQAAEAKAKQEQLANEAANLKQELNTVKVERDTAVKDCSRKNEENGRLLADNQKQKELVSSLQANIHSLQTAIYPEAFLADSDFTPLKEHLDAWRKANIAPSGIVAANLVLFAQRELLDMDSWERALKNLSLGITASMRQTSASEEQILSELVLWSKYLLKFVDETHDFSLKIPDIGDNYDDGWMTSQNRRLTTVKRVLTWAVYHNQYGIHQLAEVE